MEDIWACRHCEAGRNEHHDEKCQIAAEQRREREDFEAILRKISFEPPPDTDDAAQSLSGEWDEPDTDALWRNAPLRYGTAIRRFVLAHEAVLASVTAPSPDSDGRPPAHSMTTVAEYAVAYADLVRIKDEESI